MVDDSEQFVAMVVRVASPGRAAFQLRKGELGLSVFQPELVDPPLTESEIREAFRPSSIVLYRRISQIESLGLQLNRSIGADTLSDRLQNAHLEIQPGPTMDRNAFKNAIKELE